MWKWFLSLFGIGVLKDVDTIMKPMIKTQAKLSEAREKRLELQVQGQEEIKRIQEAHAKHEAEIRKSAAREKALDSFLNPKED